MRTPDAAENNGHYIELLSSGHQDDDDIETNAQHYHSDLLSARRDTTKRSYLRILAIGFIILSCGLFASFSLLSTRQSISSSTTLLLPHQNDDTMITSPGDHDYEYDEDIDQASVPVSVISYAKEFEDFIAKHDKQYETAAEKALRFEIFVKNLVYITAHNKDAGHNFKLAVNAFADLTLEEFKAHHVSGFQSSRKLLTSEDRPVNWGLAHRNETELPPEVDWRKSGCVSPPKDQQKCGSCWTFSSAGAVESAYCLKHGTLYDLSEQQLLDCGFPEGNQGCDGGMMDEAFKYVMDAGGICLDHDYPYTAKVGKCKDHSCKVAVKVDTFEDVPNNSEIALRAAIAEKGPTSVAIDAGSMAFQFYHSGVFDAKCGTELNHAVLVVGYGTDGKSGEKFWVVKNSWGQHWGDHGFIKMWRSTHTMEGECGILMTPSYPVVD